MHPAIKEKLASICGRYEELNALMSEPSVASNPDALKKYGLEHAQLAPIVANYAHYQQLVKEQGDLEELANDPEMAEMVAEEKPRNEKAIAESEEALARLMIPKDPLDESDVFLEIRAGTGGDEAALFAGDLFRMYSRYAETKGWQLSVLSESAGEMGGYKEIICRINGKRVYSTLKFESGAHRVQRVPETESGGRIHTSAATVAVLPESDSIDSIDINPADLRIDTFRASGAGGQHINKTDSAIRITHIPTGTVVECQDERSQHKNKAKAMHWLQAKLLDDERRKAQQAEAAERKSLVGSGDRSERIRTYNFPQNRLTDHRINLTLYALDDVMQGNLDLVIQPLIQEQEASALLALQET